MSPQERIRKSAELQRLLLTSTSAAALLISSHAHAQQTIPVGTVTTTTSITDGETITNPVGNMVVVDGNPAAVIANDDVILQNDGSLATTGITQTIQVNEDTSDATINNGTTGIITAESRAIDIRGDDVTINNSGSITGTGDQRNGTVYLDSSANNVTINNDGTIDAGAGNQGAGIAVEVGGMGPRTYNFTNTGLIQGRGNADAAGGTAGDGIRFFGPGFAPSYTVLGTITNSGMIRSEATSGTTAGIRFRDAINFQGTIENQAGGVIYGTQNGLYFGNADHTGGVVNNAGTIMSGSRAFNIDGTGLVLNNSGSIIGNAAQRNGTVYADGTANGFTLNNTGTIDAVVQGSGVAIEVGTMDGDTRSYTIVNDGTIAGRGAALPSGNSAGLRLFNGAGAGTTVTVTSDIINNGTISAEMAPAVMIEDINFTGTFFNNGTLSAAVAFYAASALGPVNFVQGNGALNGNFVGSAFTDTLTFANGASTLGGDVIGDVNVVVADAATVTVSGNRMIDGNLTVNGALNFNLNADSLAVDGDTIFGANSVVNIDTTLITQADIGTTFNVITQTGSVTNNGVTINIDENDFLLDYNIVLNSVIITSTAANLSQISDDANVSSFGAALANSIENNRLQANVFAAINGLSSTAEFEAASIGLLPAINDGVAREIFETQRFASSLLTDRLARDSGGIWGQIFIRTSDRDAESLSSVGYEGDATGYVLGVDAQISENAKIGAFFSYADITVESDGAAQAQSDINSFQFSGYAGINSETAFVNAEFGYSLNNLDTSRNSIVNPVVGQTNGDGFIGSINGGLNLGNDNVAFTPFAGLRYATLSTNPFTETLGLGLTLDTDTTDFLEGSIGLGISTKASKDENISIIPFLNLAYTYDFIGDGVGINGSFNAGADSFRLTSNNASESRFDLGAGISFVNKNGFNFAAEYQGRFASDYQSHTGGVIVRFAF